MITNSFIIGKLYKTTERCCFFRTAVCQNGEWEDAVSDANWFSEVEIPPGTMVLILANPDNRLCSVALADEEMFWVFDDDVEELV